MKPTVCVSVAACLINTKHITSFSEREQQLDCDKNFKLTCSMSKRTLNLISANEGALFSPLTVVICSPGRVCDTTRQFASVFSLIHDEPDTVDTYFCVCLVYTLLL